MQPNLSFLGPLAGVAALARHGFAPKHGLCLLMLLLPFLPQAPLGIGWLEAAYILLFGLTLASWFFKLLTASGPGADKMRASDAPFISRFFENLRAAVPASVTTWALLAFLLICVATFPIARLNGTSAGDWGRGFIPFLNLIIFFVAASELRTHQDRRLFLGCVAAAGLIVTLQAVFVIVSQQLWVPVIHRGAPNQFFAVYKRLTWYFASATSPLLLLAIVVLLGFAFRARRRELAALALLIAPMLCIVLWTWSRTSVLALAAGIAALTVLYGVKQRFAELVTALSVFGAAAVLAWLVFFALGIPILPILGGRLVQPLTAQNITRLIRAGTGGEPALEEEEDPAEADPNLVHRAEEYAIAFNAFRQQPLWGMGLGYHYEIVQPSADGKMETASLGYVHNFVAYFLMTTGLVGTLAYLVLIGAAAFELLKWFRRPLPDPTFAILITMAVTGVVLLVDAFFFAVFRLIAFNLYFGAALGILVGLRSAPDPKMHPVPRAVEAKARLAGRNIAEM